MTSLASLHLLALIGGISQIPENLPTPPPVPEPTGPIVAVETSEGLIRIALYSERSPLSVENFLRYVRSDHYVGTIFHRVMPNFMIQGGGLEPDMSERPNDPPVRNEARNGLRNSRGTVALARLKGPDTATSQFFVNLKDNHRLDFGIGGAGYAVFGKVIEGMDVVDRIATIPTAVRGPHENVPTTPVVIVGVRLETMTAAPPPTPKGE